MLFSKLFIHSRTKQQMKNLHKNLLLGTSLLLGTTLANAQMQYPLTKKIEHTDDYHGVKVSDPYHWLEDDRSAETAEWVKAENKVTFDYLEKIPYRNMLKERIEKVFNYPKYSAPSRKNEWFYFSKNDGLQNQSVLYRQKGLDGTPEIVLDPNKLSADGTTRLGAFAVSKNGIYAVYYLSKGGSDWQEGYIMDLATKQNLPDHLEWIKVSGASWQGNGFYYSRYPKPAGSALAAKNENHQVFYHKVGTSQDQDELVYENKENPQRFNSVYVSDDEKYSYLNISDRGKGKEGNALYFKKLGQKEFTPIIPEADKFSYRIVDNVGDKFLIETNEKAQNSKVESYDPATKAWKNVIPEKLEPLEGVGTAGGKMFATYLK